MPLIPLVRLGQRLRAIFRPTGDAAQYRVRRRRRMVAALYTHVTAIQIVLFTVGYAWMALIPHPSLGRGTFIDENALQPGQVNTHWSWPDVYLADKYLADLEQLQASNASSRRRADFLVAEFRKLGLPSWTQNYYFKTSLNSLNDTTGTNAYAIFPSPRATGTEAMVVSASWISRAASDNAGETINIRGVATVLALANFLKGYSLWSKDIIFVISDGYLAGMQAWLAAYHGSIQNNLITDDVNLSSGVVWTAINIDYPGHSFSHLGVFYEGTNGRLPNQDLLNSFQRIAKYTGGVPVILYDHVQPQDLANYDELPAWIPSIIRNNKDARIYAAQATNIARNVQFQALGRGSGVHGLFHQFRIDSFTLFALPASGPHGFHAIGRVIESTLRTMNNLLERLHASFFFYILSSPERFLKVGNFLPSVILISIGMMFGGLKSWVDAGWIKQEGELKSGQQDVMFRRRARPILSTLGIMCLTNIFGLLLFLLIHQEIFIHNPSGIAYILFAFLWLIPLLASVTRLPGVSSSSPNAYSITLKALNLCLASTVISIVSVLNFSLAACLAVILGIPLSITSYLSKSSLRRAAYMTYTYFALHWLLSDQEAIRTGLWDWEVLGIWFAPFICIIYVPLLFQAGLVCILP